MMTSPDAFFISSKFWFSGLFLGGGGGVKGKKWAKMTKICLTPYQLCKTMISPAIFFHFFKILDFSAFSKFINKYQKEIHMCVIFLVSQTNYFTKNL